MHRAEKSSSKLCHAREVEKAQEIHRKKIDGVKSYFTIPKPTTSRTAVALHHRSARPMLGGISSVTPTCTGSTLASSADLSLQNENDDEGSTKSDILLTNAGNQKASGGQQSQSVGEFQQSVAKMEEFRDVMPVPGLGSVPLSKTSSIKFPPPPTGARRRTVNASVRARRLKEIKADNLTVFRRIRKTESHYRNDDFQREWQQNLSYLSSITEFPLSKDLGAVTSAQKLHKGVNDKCGSSFGPSPRRPSFLSPTTHTDPLPCLPVGSVAHPIKALPTTSKKLQLNMTPGFRSLRKAMPQQPSLPPIQSLHDIAIVNNDSASLLNVHSDLLPPSSADHWIGSAERSLSSQSSTAISTTLFIGDLHGKQQENEVPGDAKYQLLKTGRFVGGTYLVLTVFCGDGVTNPYGFDVYAYHRELQCEYKLSVTKEMTHELLDKGISSTFAAETEAAAGTNLSMQEIAVKICDHINYAVLGVDQGEMVFLVPTATGKNDQAVRMDVPPALAAFCVHQTIELGELERGDIRHSNSRLHNKRRAHVFASTCPPMARSTNKSNAFTLAKTADVTILFQLMDNLPPSRSIPSEATTDCSSTLQVKAGADDIYNSILCNSRQNQHRMLSLERIAVAAIRHLHVIIVPSGDDIGTVRNELILNSHVNSLLQPCSSRVPDVVTTLEKKRSRHQLPRPASQAFVQTLHGTILLQTGLIWRNVYLLAEVALENAEDANRETWNATKWRDRCQLVKNIDTNIVISVFNSNSGHSPCRRLSPEKIKMFVERLDALPTSKLRFYHSDSEQHDFAGQLLTFLQLDVNLFGQEVIVFPVLEHATSPAKNDANIIIVGGPRQTFEDVKDTATNSPPEAQSQDILPRKTSWASENISEGDEGRDSDEYGSEEMAEETDTKSLLVGFVTGVDENEAEEESELDASSDSQNNQDETEPITAPDSSQDAYPEDYQHEINESPKLDEAIVPQDDNNCDVALPRPWKRGQKVKGRYCLLQGSIDDAENTTIVLGISALGHLD